MFLAELLVATLLTADGWMQREVVKGVIIETRPMPGSAYEEFRLTVTTPRPAHSVCESAFNISPKDPSEKDVVMRKLVMAKTDERVTYEQRHTSIVTNRDYAVRAVRTWSNDGCRIDFNIANEFAPAESNEFVRIKKLEGCWVIRKDSNDLTRVTYTIANEPGGNIPPFLAGMGMRARAVEWVRMIVDRASKQVAQASESDVELHTRKQ